MRASLFLTVLAAAAFAGVFAAPALTEDGTTANIDLSSTVNELVRRDKDHDHHHKHDWRHNKYHHRPPHYLPPPPPPHHNWWHHDRNHHDHHHH